MKDILDRELKDGGIYETTNGANFVYLGKRKVTFERLYGRWKDEKEGYCFVLAYFSEDKDFVSDEYIREKITYINLYDLTYNIYILKENKEPIKFIRKIDLDFPLVNEVEKCGDKYRLTIE